MSRRWAWALAVAGGLWSAAPVWAEEAEPAVRYVSNTVTQASKSVQWRVREGQSDDRAARAQGSTVDGRIAVRPISAAVRSGRVRQASDQTGADPFRDPFGDREAVPTAAQTAPPEDSPELTAPQAEPEPEAPAPQPPAAFRGQDAPRALPAAPPRAVESEQPQPPKRLGPATNNGRNMPPAEPDAPAERPADEAEQTVPGSPVRSAVYCRRMYNERNCCSDESLCNEHRERVKSHPLSKISLDITATCNLSSRPGTDQANCGWPFEQAPHRVWRDRSGEKLAEGRVTALANLRVEITDDSGKIIRVPFRQLSEDDICFLAAFCGVPSECRLDDMPLMARNWSPVTMTWKASGLCHKPLYFEEPQLERYGHTTGPFIQPVISGAHFFANIALLPYHMGVHPMNECEYALGYYRPGNCAPKMIPPFPLSLRGALWETGVVVGGIYVFP